MQVLFHNVSFLPSKEYLVVNVVCSRVVGPLSSLRGVVSGTRATWHAGAPRPR